MLKNDRNFFFWHIVAWLIYGIGLYGYNLVFSTDANLFHAFSVTLLFAFVFYISVSFFDFFLSRGHWLLGLMALISFFVFMTFFAYAYVYWILPEVNIKLYYEDVDFDNLLFMQVVFDYFFKFFVYAIFYTVTRKYVETVRQRAVYEQAFLRQQIYPHFQHNIMQSFINEAKKNGNTSFAGQISILSDLMSYSAESMQPEKDRVFITREIRFIEKIVRLIRERAGSDEVVQYERQGDAGVAKIPPLTLLTFVENAVKYGDFTRDEPLVVQLSCSDNQFVFYCKNRIAARVGETGSFKLGIPNTIHRLKAFFGRRYQLSFSEEAGFYAVRLSIEL